MKKITNKILFGATCASVMACAGMANAQSVPAAFTMSRQDLRGTARFMSMGGAFGALGGDLSVLSQNPGGIGVYRNSDVGITFDLDALSSKSNSNGMTTSDDWTRFNLNNIGIVFSLRLGSSSMPNVNFGFTYDRVTAFSRHYQGNVPNLQNSLSNYIAGMTNAYGLTENDFTNGDPYNPGYDQAQAPWLTIIGFDSYLTNPEVHEGETKWYGQFGEGTSGKGRFDVWEKGYVDEYNLALGGNIANQVFWGIDFGITSLEYQLNSMWGETLQDAYVYDPNKSQEVRSKADWNIFDNYRISGTGLNFKLGLIYKPIQELRLGFAFHTPTFYNLTETYYNIGADMKYDFDIGYNHVVANDDNPVSNTLSFNTPWRIIASAAGVIANKVIVSADYQWDNYAGMQYSNANYYGYYDPWTDWYEPGYDWYSSSTRSSYYDANTLANNAIKRIYKNSSTLRFGVEYRVIPSLSLRAGYCFVESPVKNEVKQGKVEVPGTGVLSSYTLDNSTNYLTLGLGYRVKGFYADLAYVYKQNSSEYYPFCPDTSNPDLIVKSDLTFKTSQVVLSLGYKF